MLDSDVNGGMDGERKGMSQCCDCEQSKEWKGRYVPGIVHDRFIDSWT